MKAPMQGGTVVGLGGFRVFFVYCLGLIVNSRMLEHGLRLIRVGIPFSIPFGYSNFLEFITVGLQQSPVGNP